MCKFHYVYITFISLVNPSKYMTKGNDKREREREKKKKKKKKKKKRERERERE